MHSAYDYKKYAILYVDDEEKSLTALRRAVGERFRVLTAPNAQEGLRQLEEHKQDLAVIMTDQRMPGEKGVQLLERARQIHPRMIRILVTAYSDFEVAIDAVNSGAIYKYISKPWDPPQLEMTLRRALEFFIVQRERDELLREKLSALHNMMITDRVISLGVAAAGLGHYVRNSLVAVQTFLDLAPSKLKEENLNIEDLRNPNFWGDFYKHVQSQLRRISHLLGGLQIAGENREAHFDHSLQTRSFIDGVAESMSVSLAEHNLKVENLVPAELPAIKVDEPKIRQLFELLLKDEIINLPPGSTIIFRARELPPEPGKPPFVEIQMQDNGPGVSTEALRSVFDPFFVRNDNPQEFGINLMTCYFIVYHHGGWVSVKNREGGGTTFTFTMPVNANPAPPGADEEEFLAKVMLNETLWERLLTSE